MNAVWNVKECSVSNLMGDTSEEIGIKPTCNNLAPFELLLYLPFPCLIHKPIIMPHDGFGLKFDTLSAPPFI